MMNRLLALLVLSAIGCGKDASQKAESSIASGDPNDAARVAISVALTQSGPVDALPEASDADGALVVVESATISVRDIELDMPEGRSCADVPPEILVDPVECSDDKLRVNGPITFDLVNRSASPPLSEVMIPMGTYKRIDLRLDPDAAPDEQSLTFSGAVNGAPFDLSLPMNEDARFENEEGIHLGDWGRLVAHLDLDAVMADVPLEDCIDDLGADEDGVVYVTEDRCKDVEDTLKDSLKNTFDLD